MLTPDELLKEYPVLVLDEATSTEYLLVHVLGHLAYHLGQINYNRRLLDQWKFLYRFHDLIRHIL